MVEDGFVFIRGRLIEVMLRSRDPSGVDEYCLGRGDRDFVRTDDLVPGDVAVWDDVVIPDSILQRHGSLGKIAVQRVDSDADHRGFVAPVLCLLCGRSSPSSSSGEGVYSLVLTPSKSDPSAYERIGQWTGDYDYWYEDAPAKTITLV